MRKAISPLVATVLLIGFTVAVAGIVVVWLTTFATTSTEDVGEKTETELYCAYGGIRISDLQFCNNYLSGILHNTNLIDIGNITIQITYLNATPAKTIYLAQNGTSISGYSEMGLKPRELATFNVSIGGSNYNKVHVYTNCSNVYDDAGRADVTVIC